MTEVTIEKPLRVSTTTNGVSYIDLPLTQLPEVQRLLDEQGVHYWVTENAISLNGGPYMTYIYLERREDPMTAQAILDGSR